MVVSLSRSCFPQSRPSPIATLNSDLLKLILYSLPRDSKKAAGLVCHRWHRLTTSEQYREGQIKGRIQIVSEIYYLITNAYYRKKIEMVLDEAKKYPQCDYEAIRKKLQTIIDLYLNNYTSKKSPLKSISRLKVYHTLPTVESGVFEALKTHLRRIIATYRPKTADETICFTPLMYHIYLRALSTYKVRYLLLNHSVEIERSEDMDFLKSCLRRFSHIQTLELSNYPENDRSVDWNLQLMALKETLSTLHSLRKLVFSNLRNPLADASLPSIGEIARRQQLKTVVFGRNSITGHLNWNDMLNHLNYKKPLKVIFFDERITFRWPPGR